MDHRNSRHHNSFFPLGLRGREGEENFRQRLMDSSSFLPPDCGSPTLSHIQ